MNWICTGCQKQFPLANVGPKRKTHLCNLCHQTNWRLKNKEHLSNYRKLNKEKISLKAKEWFSFNKEDRREYKRNYYKHRKKSDPLFKIKTNLRSRLYDAIKGKNKSTETLLGCSYSDFITYLQSKFYNHPLSNEEMTLQNYGQWHIDHINPLYKYDLSDPNQMQDACHYTNLQPLWYIDHVKKTSTDLK